MKSKSLYSFSTRAKARVVAMGILIRSRFRWHISCGRGGYAQYWKHFVSSHRRAESAAVINERAHPSQVEAAEDSRESNDDLPTTGLSHKRGDPPHYSADHV